jgi:hypothetical protein
LTNELSQPSPNPRDTQSAGIEPSVWQNQCLKGFTTVLKYMTAAQLSGTVFPLSVDSILRIARQNGIGRRMGKSIIFSPNDIEALYEVSPCPSSSNAGTTAQTGSCAALCGESALKKALALASDQPPKKFGRNGRQNCSTKRSMGGVLSLPSPTRP